MKNSLIITLVGFTYLLSCASGENIEKDQKPNVIILFSDQHQKKAMGFEGHPDVITPNLDRLASVGLVFDRAYCSQGICAPSGV